MPTEESQVVPEEQEKEVEQKEQEKEVDYSKLTNDLHKFKRQARELEAEKSQLQKKLEEIDLKKLEESEEHQKLAQHYRAKYEEANQKLTSVSESIMNEAKINAVEREARKRGIKNDKYLDLILKEIDDEVIVEATSTGRRNVLGADSFMDRIKETYPDFFADQKPPNMNNSTGDYRPGQKLTGAELVQLRKKDPEKYMAYMKKQMNQ